MKIENKNSKKLDEIKVIKGNIKWGFVKICNVNEVYVMVKLMSNDVLFDKLILYLNLYIVINRKIILNKKFLLFLKKRVENNFV